MDALFFFIIFSHFIFSIFFSQPCDAKDDVHFASCPPFSCGNLGNISYPFWTEDLDRPAYCGHSHQVYKLKCAGNDHFPVMTINSEEYQVLNLNQSHGSMTIRRLQLGDGTSCPEQTLIYGVFNYSGSAQNITLSYNCDNYNTALGNQTLSCKRNGFESTALFLGRNGENTLGCGTNMVEVPVEKKAWDELMKGSTTLDKALFQQFDMRYFAYDAYCYDCIKSGGRCGSNQNIRLTFACYCPDQPYLFKCESPHSASGNHGINWKGKLGIGLGALVAGILITSIFFYYRHRKCQGKPIISKWPFVSGSTSSNLSLMVDPERGDSSIAGVHLFTYEELEKATCNFDSEKQLGDGGFGTVYYGELRDGRTVAVKRLYENNYKRVEQFMNEVEILTRLRHKNLVSLYGSTSRHSRELLLVYEYVPNGTVADHLHGEIAKPGALPWPIRLQIAIETADALRYLHASGTIHRDVKTNNILLDNNFSVKVADFGLSRLFPDNVTHVSTAPQGTPGYVDPEYHQCYQLTDKSDVFSFGVVLIELISSKPAVDITRHRHEINLSNMAINKIQNRALHELVDPSLGFESECKVRKMITGVAEVAFQCLQSEKEMRPRMEEVFDALICIQNKDYNKEKAEEMDILEEVVLLKSGPIIPHSPDSVITYWPSNSASTTSSV